MYRLFVDQHRQHARLPCAASDALGEDGGDALAQFASAQGNPEADTEAAARQLVLLQAIERRAKTTSAYWPSTTSKATP